MKISQYIYPGYYVAVCNNTNFDGHYARLFWYPGQMVYAESTMIPPGLTPDSETFEGEKFTDAIAKRLAESPGALDAAHYFLNRVDYTSCVNAVFPMEIFVPHKMLATFLKVMGAEETEGYVVTLHQGFFARF
jgi:hypothetical protein